MRVRDVNRFCFDQSVCCTEFEAGLTLIKASLLKPMEKLYRDRINICLFIDHLFEFFSVLLIYVRCYAEYLLSVNQSFN